MGFLGVTFAMALTNIPTIPRMLSIVFMPSMIIRMSSRVPLIVQRITGLSFPFPAEDFLSY